MRIRKGLRWLFILFIFYFMIKFAKYESPPKFYGVENGILVLAGTHGNEPAPSEYLSKNLEKYVDKMGIFPEINENALLLGIRGNPDVNRKYHVGGEREMSEINLTVAQMLKNSRVVIDFHEAWGFHKCTPPSMGQSIYATPHAMSIFGDKIRALVSSLNVDENDKCKMWTLLTKVPPLEGSIDAYCIHHRVPYILVEMAGQNNIVKKEDRYSTTEKIMSWVCELEV
jgi:hypothetical protein